jgi:general transcription factor 3C polypeptide 3 (transcription factor C subunit 4)
MITNLDHYNHALDIGPRDPLVHFCIGLCHLHLSMQRKVENRHFALGKALTFLFQYTELAENKAEADYNMARAMHQLGLVHLAVPLYEKVLQVEEARESGLAQTAAYNLSLIYVSVGSSAVARDLLKTYCTI